MNITNKIKGFSLIELMISVLVIAILASVAVPSFQSWLRNTQVRNAAESIANGLQKARAEAVSRNTKTTLVLGADTGWSVNVVSPASVIEQRLAAEGSKNVTRTVLPATSSTVTFNSFGLIDAANADGSAPFTRVDLAATGSSQPLRVTIGTGGNAKMCDPALPSSNPRGC